MDKIRSRKYTYELFSATHETIQAIKQTDCLYHAVVLYRRRNGSVYYMRGFIYFKNAKSVATINKWIEKCKTTNYNVTVSQDRPHDIHNGLNDNDDVWEYGSPPVQGGSKPMIFQSLDPPSLDPPSLDPPSLDPPLLEQQQNQMTSFEERVIRLLEKIMIQNHQRTLHMITLVNDLTDRVNILNKQR